MELATRTGIRGAKRSVWVLVAALPFSGAQTAHFSFDATLESFLEAHVRVFAWLEGVPQECRYHQLRPVIAKRDGRGALRWNKRFRELRAHYGFRTSIYPPADALARAGDPSSGADRSLQSSVEQLKRSFLPGRRFGGPSELDALYAEWRDAVANLRNHTSAGGPMTSAGPTASASPMTSDSPTSTRGSTIAQLLAQERRALRTLPPERFDYSLRRAVSVGPDGYVRHGASFYRAPDGCANRRVELHASRDEVWIMVGGKRVANYPRSYRLGRRLPQPLV